MSFFPHGVAASDRQKTPDKFVGVAPRCGDCGYYKTCNSPKMKPAGSGDVLVIGDFPDTHSDLVGKSISGAAAALLSRTLSRVGRSTADVVIMNALSCRPDTTGGEKSTGVAVRHCRPLVRQAIDKYKPKVIIPMGDLAIQSVIAPFRPPGDRMAASRWSGYQIPLPPLGAWVCPTVDPKGAALAADGDGSLGGRRTAVPSILFDGHVRAAVGKVDDDVTVTDPAKGVSLVGEVRAVRWLDAVVERGGIVAFDFETTGLKPDLAAQRIVCCSVCYNGNNTIAFMWTPVVQAAMIRLLRSDTVGKVASNMMFETRWCMAKLRTRVNRWVWDTMQVAHVLDARGDDPADGITSIKFQAFALFGVEPWNGGVDKYLGAAGANALNRVHEIDQRTLLTYCAIDSRMEYLVARRQSKMVGVNLEDWR